MSNLFLNRRSVLGLLSASVIAGASQPVAALAASGHGFSTAAAASQLNRPDRIFLARGLMHGAWIRSGSQDGWIPDTALWNQSGFTTPTFYNPPLWSSEVMDPLSNSTWSVAKAPVGASLAGTRPPAANEWLTSDQLAHVDRLFTACFGDEEAYADDIVNWLADAYAATHQRHPDVLVHNNQALGQYTDAQMRHYIQTAKPDLISYDNYYWQYAKQFDGGSVTPLYSNIARYRRLALEGLDGTGADPIGFGQYTCGFKLIPEGGPATTRRYFVSESQQHLVSNVTWAVGGRWLDLFRWEKGPTTGSDTTDGQFLNFPDGTPTPQFNRYVQLNQALRAYSPYLTRLRTRSTAIVRGVVGSTGALVAQPANMSSFAASTDPGSGVTGISATNVGTVNSGARGDVVFGSFRHLPNMSTEEAGSWLPDKDNSTAFMIVNALSWANTDVYSATSTGGNSEDTRQTITVTVDPTLNGSRSSAATLWRIDKATGQKVQVALQASGPAFQFTASMGGGQGELYLWA